MPPRKNGPCWKCEKPTRSHVDMLMVYHPRGHVYLPIFTCHSCFDKLEEGELTEYKIKLRDKIKGAAMAAIQDEKVEAVRNQQDESGEHILPLDRSA